MKRFLLLLEATLKTQNMKPINNTEPLPDEFITDIRNFIENDRKKAYVSYVLTPIYGNSYNKRNL